MRLAAMDRFVFVTDGAGGKQQQENVFGMRRYFTVCILSLLDSGQTYAGQRKFVLRKQFSVYCEKILNRICFQVRQFISGGAGRRYIII